jgi:hypothetical protein
MERPALVSHGYEADQNTDVMPLERCHGDCDHDGHCKAGFTCHQQNQRGPIPGCKGLPEEGMDYCVGQSGLEVPVPHPCANGKHGGCALASRGGVCTVVSGAPSCSCMAPIASPSTTHYLRMSDGSGASIPADDATPAAVRCCNLSGTPVTDAASAYGCHGSDKTFNQAETICKGHGYRMCTVHEIERQFAAKSSCGGEALVWTSKRRFSAAELALPNAGRGFTCASTSCTVCTPLHPDEGSA